MADHVRLGPEDVDLVGRWVWTNGAMHGDATCERIKEVTANRLRELGRAEGGWSILYEDPEDDRLWELTYPQSEMHGGGPPRLTWVSRETARTKYGLAG